MTAAVTEEVSDAEEDATDEDEVNIEVGFRGSELVDDVDGATQQLENGLKAVDPIAEDQVLVSCRHTECHIEVRYGHEKLLPESNMSRIRVSIGVLPTKRTKNNCSMTCGWERERDIVGGRLEIAFKGD